MPGNEWKNKVKAAASGHWREILSAAGQISTDILDGRGHPCPKCGGTDRFSMVDEAAGAVLCRKCFSTKNGDGLAAIQWLTGCDFLAALQAVADHTGVVLPPRPVPTPDQHLQLQDWSDELARVWCLLWKPGITPAAMIEAGCRRAVYRERWPVFALPVFGPDMNRKPIGWVLWSVSGGKLPAWSPDGKLSWVKMKTTSASERGLIGEVALHGMAEAEVVWKCEGPGDMLALAGIIPPELRGKHVAVTNSAGTNEQPAVWYVNLLAGKTVYVLHDADVPGQFGSEKLKDSPEPGGAARWAAHLARKAASCRNVELPYPIEPTSGKDVRDWILAGHAYPELLQLAEQSTAAAAVDPKPLKAVNDPDYLAQQYLDRHQTADDQLLIGRYQGEWIRFHETCWKDVPLESQLGELSNFAVQEFDARNIEDQEGGGAKDTLKVTRTLIGNVEARLKALCMQGTAGLSPGEHRADGKRRDWIALENGCLHVDEWLEANTDCLHPHDPGWLNFSALPFDYDPAAECPKWLAFLDRVMEGDGDRIDLLQEFLGYCLVHDTSMQSMLLLHGSGANGKSVFLAAAEALIGTRNCSHVPLEVLGERFQLMPTIHKLANLAAECGTLDREAENTLKKIVSGDRLTMDRKFMDPIAVTPTVRLIVSCNSLPRFADRTDGVWRRLIIVPFRVTIPQEERVQGMDAVEWWQDSGELPGMLNWSLDGLYRLRTQGPFTEPAVCIDAKNRHREETDPAGTFLREQYVASSEGEEAVKDVYSQYCGWCEENGHRPASASQFGRSIRRCFPRVEIKQRRAGGNKDRVRFYSGISKRESRAEILLGSSDSMLSQTGRR